MTIITIIDFLIMFVGGFILFWLFTIFVIDPINKTVNDISSKNALEEILKDYEKDK